MAGVRNIVVGLVVAGGLAWAASPASALGISIPETGTLSALSPGQTSTATGISLGVSGVLLPWSLYVAPEPSPTPGRLRASSSGCAGSPPALATPLHLDTVAGVGTTTVDQPSYDIVAGAAQVAHGTASDVLTLAYSQPVGAAEALVAGCRYSITLTFTVS